MAFSSIPIVGPLLSAPSAPGVAGPAQPGQSVVYDPATGLYVNRNTGAVSTDPGGQNVVQNPSLATQAARNVSISNNLLTQSQTFNTQYTNALQGQQALAAQIQKQLSGQAPSVAQTQLQQGLDQVQASQNAEAAGASGEDAALARSEAAQNIGAAQAATNQSKALLRANEVANDTQEEAGVLGNEANEASGMYGTTLSGGLQASGQAEQAEGAKENADLQGQTAQRNLDTSLINAAGNIAAKGATAGSAPAATTSDKREKKNIKGVGDQAIKAFIDHVAGFTFDYKHPGTPGENPGNRVGQIAQKVQKGGPIGKAVVIDGKPLQLDVPNSIGAALAAINYLKRELDKKKDK